MDVLITGGSGFIGSFVAERFHKEGHKIYIIDNLSTGRRENLTIPHKLYTLDVEDPKCDEVFQSVSPDVVIHLAAQVDVATSILRPQLDTQSNINGLVNMLQCAKKSGAGKFIFASSAAVYGKAEEIPLREDAPAEPLSPYGINKKMGEYYCAKWKEMYGLDTLCFRFSNVYGPRQGGRGEGGVVSIFAERIIEGRELTVYGDGGQTRDFIFVRDVVDAIYRGAMSGATGVYNLSTQSQTSVNRLLETLGKFAELPKIAYSEPRPGDIYHSSLDNSRVKKDLDWVPLYSIEEGLKLTYEWFREKTPDKADKPRERKASSVLWSRWIKPLAENLIAFAAVAVLAKTDLLFHSNIDFKLIYVILLGVVYGMRQSILSAVLASGLYFYESLSAGREWVSLLYDPESLFNVAIYLFFGFLVGFVVDRNKRTVKQTKTDLNVLREKYSFLKGIYSDTKSIKEQLQRQLIGSKDSIGRIYGIIRQLEKMEPEEVVTSSVGVLTEIMEAKRISVYSTNGSDYMRLLLHSYDTGFSLPKTMRLSDHPQLRDVALHGRMFVNRELTPDLPMFVAPVMQGDQVVALVSLHDPDFERLNLRYENLFKVCVELISGSLSRAFQYVGATRSDRFVGDTSVLQSAVFKQVLESKAAAKMQYNADYVLLGIEQGDEELKPVADRLTSALRDSDYLGMVDGELVLLLSNSSESDAAHVIHRLDRTGIRTRRISEEQLYG
ncbi:NAD-dependent epimerase/dehydratase family protein [Cohnella thailandensis]|uniref:GDP-mannose 4,6-dehydratase n=1 Tax=Cohnella thailandensis TaxID=557557 RepID=A0A841SQK6_9BACL|nr:NAD-dependent epimerase/dehydratase family protein [Cohnella thailandensis]MBB6634693.1 GDP-mannose 4,6-dehydratase [Cohnella thailandensis]MBP1972751.1 nucleoside-diphosphate-sugar epimerase [Cohnella thailandensis]